MTSTEIEYQTLIATLCSQMFEAYAASEVLRVEDIVRDLIPDAPGNAEVRKAWTKCGQRAPVFDAAMNSKVKAMAKEERLVAALGVVPADARQFCAAYVARERFAVRFNNTIRRPDGSYTNTEEIKGAMFLTANSLALPFGERLIACAVDEWVRSAKAERREDMRRKVWALPQGKSAEGVHAELLDLCARFFRDEPGFASAMIADFMWQVKRKLGRLPVTNHHLLNVTGPQGSGKSQLVEQMAGVLEELVLATTFTELGDTRGLNQFAYPVIVLDEMTHADRADINRLKSIITAPELSARVMRSHDTIVGVQDATLVSTSNTPLATSIHDTTGMRRFAELTSRSKAETQEHFAFLSAFNWLAVWQSVDALAESPYVPYAVQLEQQQVIATAKTHTAEWLEQFDFEGGCSGYWSKDANGNHIFAADLHAIFSGWESDAYPGSRNFLTSLKRFGADLREMIASGNAPGWSHAEYRNKTRYTYECSNIIPLGVTRKLAWGESKAPVV